MRSTAQPGEVDWAALRDRLRTVVAVPVSPFASSLDLDRARYRSHVESLVGSGVSAVTINGNTGEFFALSTSERRQLMEDAVAVAPTGTLLIAGVGLDVQTAITEAQHAGELGIECIMVHQPPHPYQSCAGWVDYHAAIAAAVPHVGVIPYVRDPSVGAAAIRGLCDAGAALVGVKYSVPDPTALAQAVADTSDREITWICGLAESWAPSFWAAGATGFTSALVAVNATRSHQLLEALVAGDAVRARSEWALIRPFEAMRARNGSENNVSIVKAALSLQQEFPAYVRPPISMLSAPDLDELRAILRTWEHA